MTQGHVRIAGRLAIIGGGRMGEAILAGLLASGAMGPDDIVVAEPLPSRRSELLAAHGVACEAEAAEAVRMADIVLLAVKPQIMDDLVSSISSLAEGRLLVSIAAGVSCARIESLLPAGTAVVRVMPNTPAIVGEGMSIVSGGTEATAEQVDLVRELFSFVGRSVVIDERYQDAGMAISGAGPAYMALFIDALARAGVREGLSRDIAQMLAIQTMLGTAKMLEVTGVHPEELVDGVTSPGGATIAAIEQFEVGGLRGTVFKAVAASVRRAKELGS